MIWGVCYPFLSREFRVSRVVVGREWKQSSVKVVANVLEVERFRRFV